MSSTTLCRIVRAAVIAVAICGLIGCGYILPTIGMSIVQSNPEFAHWYWPWLMFLYLAAAPCFAMLALIWKVSSAIRHERVFSMQVARVVKTASMLLLFDVAFFFAGNIVLLLLSMNHPSIVLLSLFVAVLGLALAVSAAVLARYLTKAAALQEEADGTI